MGGYGDEEMVAPDGLTIRRRRRRLGVSRRDFVALIGVRARRATGISETVSRSVLRGVEEANEHIPYHELCLIAAGLDCNPVELLQAEDGAARATEA